MNRKAMEQNILVILIVAAIVLFLLLWFQIGIGRGAEGQAQTFWEWLTFGS